jgi:hypothetical protein
MKSFTPSPTGSPVFDAMTRENRSPSRASTLRPIVPPQSWQ